MNKISRATLFDKLNPTLYKNIEDATVVAKLQRTLEHLSNGAQGVDDLSANIDTAVERAWERHSARHIRAG